MWNVLLSQRVVSPLVRLTGSRTGTWRCQSSPSWRINHNKDVVSETAGGRFSQTPSCVTTTHLDMAQMKSMETAHLYLGASSWSSWLTWASSCKVTREEIWTRRREEKLNECVFHLFKHSFHTHFDPEPLNDDDDELQAAQIRVEPNFLKPFHARGRK